VVILDASGWDARHRTLGAVVSKQVHPGIASLSTSPGGDETVIVLGAILLILGLIFNAGILWTIGLILIAVGILLAILGMLDRAVGPRRYYY
jgi:hypothetical protein